MANPPIIKIKFGRKEEAPPVVEGWISEFEEALKARWENPSKEILELMEDTEKAINPYGVVKSILESMMVAGIPSEDETKAIVDKYISQSFAYGSLIALGGENAVEDPPSGKIAIGLSKKSGFVDKRALQFTLANAFNEVVTKDAEILGRFRRFLISALENKSSPFKASGDIQKELNKYDSSWATISRTEIARALSKGSYDQTRELGVSYVYIPKTNTACPYCSKQLEGRVFPLDTIEGASNYGKKAAQWEAAIPMHPNCTHYSIPASKWLVDQAKEKNPTIPKEGVAVDYTPPKERKE